MTIPKIGQVWEDCDKRFSGNPARKIILAIEEGFAICRSEPSGKTVKIALRRFKPTSTGYRVIIEPPERKPQ